MATILRKDLKENDMFKMLAPHVVDKFMDYHTQNPHIFKLFCGFALELKNKGRANYGAKAIMERIRWHIAVETTGEDFKIGNNHTSCYARLYCLKFPGNEGFFRLRNNQGRVDLQ